MSRRRILHLFGVIGGIILLGGLCGVGFWLSGGEILAMLSPSVEGGDQIGGSPPATAQGPRDADDTSKAESIMEGAPEGEIPIPEDPPVLLGMYPWGSFRESIVQIQAMDEWAGVRNSIAATFMDLNDPLAAATLGEELTAAWAAGYTPFINLAVFPRNADGSCPPELTAEAIAEGSLDPQIRRWAENYQEWVEGDPSRGAFIAPLQEMNGYWICYGLDPEGYHRVFARVQRIFEAAGVPAGQMSWVFAPNGWSSPEDPTFEAYYPGNSLVDVVAFSAYNFAACSPYPGDDWRSPEEIFGGYLARMRAMAPGKPIFIAETATTSMRQDGTPGGKSKWLRETYAYFDRYEAVQGVLYFNVDERPSHEGVPDCDFPIYKPPQVMGYEGYRGVVNDPEAGYAYVPPADMRTLAFERQEGMFEDVWPVDPLAGVPEVHWRRPWIEAVVAAGIMAPCGEEILLREEGALDGVSLTYFCPNEAVTRGDIAQFLGRVMAAQGKDLNLQQETVFEDVSSSDPRAPWIQGMVELGVIEPCDSSPPRFCVDDPIMRADAALFMGKAKSQLIAFKAGDLDELELADVPAQHPAAEWIEHVVAAGIMELCEAEPPIFCPGGQVTRAQTAVYLARAFGIAVD